MAHHKRESGFTLEEISQLSAIVARATAYRARKEEEHQAQLHAQSMEAGTESTIARIEQGLDPAMVDKAQTPDLEETRNGPPSPEKQERDSTQAVAGAQELGEERSRRTVSPITPPATSQTYEVNGHSADSATFSRDSVEPAIDFVALLRVVKQTNAFYARKEASARAYQQSDMAGRRATRSSTKSPDPQSAPADSDPLPSVETEASRPPKRKANQSAASHQSKRTKTNASEASAHDSLVENRDTTFQSHSQAPATSKAPPAARSPMATPARSTPKRKAADSASPAPQPKRIKTANKKTPQLGSDPDRPGLVTLKVSFPLPVGSKDAASLPQADECPTAPIEPVIGSRPIDRTPHSGPHGGVEVQHPNEDRLSGSRHHLNFTVTQHLLEAMKYVAAHEPAKPLQWLSDTFKARSELVEGAWIEDFHYDKFSTDPNTGTAVLVENTRIAESGAVDNPTAPTVLTDPTGPADTSATESQTTTEPIADTSEAKTSDARSSTTLIHGPQISETEANASEEAKVVESAEEPSASDVEAAKTVAPPLDELEAEDHALWAASAEAVSAPPNSATTIEEAEHAKTPEDSTTPTMPTDTATAKGIPTIEVPSADTVSPITDSEPVDDFNITETEHKTAETPEDTAISTTEPSDDTALPPLAVKTHDNSSRHGEESTSAPTDSTPEITPPTPTSRPPMRPGQHRRPNRDSVGSITETPTGTCISTSPMSNVDLFDRLVNQDVQHVPKSAPIVKAPDHAPPSIEERLRRLAEESDKLERAEATAAAKAAAKSQATAAESPAAAPEEDANNASSTPVLETINAEADAAAHPIQGHEEWNAQEKGLALDEAWNKSAEEWSELDDELFGESPVSDSFPEERVGRCRVARKTDMR